MSLNVARIAGWGLLVAGLLVSLALVRESERRRIEAEQAELSPLLPLAPDTLPETLPVERKPAAIADGHDFPDALRSAALMATVRVANDTQSAAGSGVLIGSQGPFAYILTAEHVVRQGSPLSVEVFDPAGRVVNAPSPHLAEVVARSSRADLALLRTRSSQHLPKALHVCPLALIPNAGGFAGVTIGCSRDEAPTAAFAQVLEKQRVRRQTGEQAVAVWRIDRAGVRGRSGGPLIDRRGFVLGIASGESEGRAVYCHTSEIHRLLKENGFQWLCEEWPRP